MTNASGKASFTYTGTAPGNDTITACFDADKDGSCESGEPTATASKTYVGVVPGPTISINDVSVVEGPPGTTVNAVFKVTLSGASTTPVTVDFATANGSATGPPDYQPASGTASFAPGDTEEDVVVAVNGDATPEPDEDFFVNLSNATNATIADAQGKGTIKTDVACPPGTSDPSYCVEPMMRRLAVGRSGVAVIPVSCPASRSAGCTGRLTLRAAGSTRTATRLGARAYKKIPAGRTRGVKVRLSKKAVRTLRRARRVRVRAIARERVGRRRVTRGIGTFTLKAPGRG